MKTLSSSVFLAFLLVSLFASAAYINIAGAGGTIYINADGSITPPSAPISSVDKVTYILTGDLTDSIVVERSNIVIDGAGHSVTGDGTGNGFKLTNISNVTIKNTNIENFTYGVYIESASSIVVRENNITANSYDGMGLFYCSSTLISRNSITWNGYDGIENYDSSYGNVSGNYIAENGWFGIEIYDSSNNEIFENRVADNYNGIELSYSPDCKVYHNDFANHTLQTSIVSSIAVWDNGYPSGGNYWSDYTGTDGNGDGIGDTPYTVDSNNKDNYPLMNPWTNIAIVHFSPSKNIIGQGYPANIEVTVQNQGWDAETTNVTIYANTTTISTLTSIVLPRRSQSTLTFTWQTATYAKGNYTLNAKADRVPGETDTADNPYIYGVVSVVIPGDVDGNFRVDMTDIMFILDAFGSTKGQPRYDTNCDFDDNLRIDMTDVFAALDNFGKHYP